MTARRLLTTTSAALAVAVLVVVGLLLGAPRASAEPGGPQLIAGAVTDVTLDRTHGPAAEHIGVTLTWSVPDTARAGDYFEFTLPQDMAYRSETTFPVLESGGTNVVAQATVQGRTARFTLTSYADNHTDVAGTAWFKMSLETDAWTPGDRVLSFELDGATVTVPFTVDPAKAPSTGSGTWDAGKGGWYDAAKAEIMWRVIVPPVEATSVTVVDHLGPNQAFVGDPYGSYTPLYEGKQILPVTTVAIPRDAFTWTDSTDPETGRPVRTITVRHSLTKDMGLTIRQSSSVLDPAFEQATNEATLQVTTPAQRVLGRTTWRAAGGSGLGATHGKIAVTKVSAGSGALLAGAAFDVLDDAQRIVAQLVTGADGSALTAMLPAGTYSLVETKAPAGHVLASGPIVLTVTAGEATPVTVVNEPESDEPDDPTDPVDPVEPVEPADPVEPTDPVEPVEPDDPAGPTQPVVPELPGPRPAPPHPVSTNPPSGARPPAPSGEVPTSAAPERAEHLARTGAEIALTGVVGAVLAGTGAALVVWIRRRTRTARG